MPAALEMLMVQNRSAHNRKIAVGADEEMRELVDEVAKSFKRLTRYFHRNMLLIKDDAVMRIIDIRRILHEPVFAV